MDMQPGEVRGFPAPNTRLTSMTLQDLETWCFPSGPSSSPTTPQAHPSSLPYPLPQCLSGAGPSLSYLWAFPAYSTCRESGQDLGRVQNDDPGRRLPSHPRPPAQPRSFAISGICCLSLFLPIFCGVSIPGFFHLYYCVSLPLCFHLSLCLFSCSLLLPFSLTLCISILGPLSFFVGVFSLHLPCSSCSVSAFL